MTSTLKINNLDTASGTTITVPTGKQLIVTDEGAVRVPGAVLQVVQATDAANTVANSTSFAAMPLQADITPKSTSSKILCMVTGGVDTNTAGRGAGTTIFRTISGGSGVNLATSNGGQQRFGYDIAHSRRLQITSAMQFLDAPSTTSSVNYRVYLQSTASANVEYPGTYQTKVMMLMEIAQ